MSASASVLRVWTRVERDATARTEGTGRRLRRPGPHFNSSNRAIKGRQRHDAGPRAAAVLFGSRKPVPPPPCQRITLRYIPFLSLFFFCFVMVYGRV